MENLLNHVDIIYNRKKNIWKLVREKPNKNYQEKDNIYGKDWFIIGNKGGGDCFFYSIIDSNIELVYQGEDLRNKYEGNREDFVKELRRICIGIIKKMDRDSQLAIITSKKIEYEDEVEKYFHVGSDNVEKYIGKLKYPDNARELLNHLKQNFLFENLVKWYDAMLFSSYWADNSMMAAFITAFKIIPILIETGTSKISDISCGLISLEEFLEVADILRNSEDYKYIVMWYEKFKHFEIMKTNNYSGKLIEYFDDFKHLEMIVPGLANDIIEECKFQQLE